MSDEQARPTVQNTGEPAYMQIARIVEDQIEAGDLHVGDQLPSTAQLCAKFSVSPSVVKAAVSVLRTKGLVIGMQGRGVFVADPAERPYAPEPADGELLAELKRIRQTIAELGDRVAAIEAAVFEGAPRSR